MSLCSREKGGCAIPQCQIRSTGGQYVSYWIAYLFKICLTCDFQKLANLLYKAASECGCVDPTRVEEILGVSKQEAAIPDKSAQG